MSKSSKFFQEAQHFIPGGVNSPVRAFKNLGQAPKFIEKGNGPFIWDVDGNKYIDYVLSWGPLILGHAPTKVKEQILAAIDHGWSFGAPTCIETKLAKRIHEIMPTIEMIRMVNSGTEATMTALRLARGFTKRNKILKFEGCYHGHNDALLIKAGSGALTLGIPTSAGISESTPVDTLTVAYNDLETTQEVFKKYGHDIAAIIVEPIAGNMNLVIPQQEFINGLRLLCNEYQSVLIFDEVMTGFRVALGGAQSIFNIKPDLTCLGKVIGGGFPVGAVGGKSEIMEHLAPLGPVYQAGTLSGNPVAMAAGLATLEEITKPGVLEILYELTDHLSKGVDSAAQKYDIPFLANNVGSMFGFHFMDDDNQNQFKQFHAHMLAQGVYLAPSAFEAGFVSTTHTKGEIDYTIGAAEEAFATLANGESNLRGINKRN